MVRRRRENLILACLLALFAGQTLWFVFSHSNTFDEPPVIGAGAAYLHTGRLDIEYEVHPPFIKYLFGAMALLANPAVDTDSPRYKNNEYYAFGLDFIYHNVVSPLKLVRLPRLVSVALGALMGWFIFLWARRWYGFEGGALALALFALDPNILAHSGLANMDIALSAFLFMAVFFLVRSFEEDRPSDLWWCGLSAGLAVVSKSPGLFFGVWFAGLLSFLLWNQPGKVGEKSLRALKACGIVLAAVVAVIIVVYQVRHLHRYGEALGYLVKSFTGQLPGQHHVNFFLGEHGTGGWKLYYAAAFLLKSTIPFLILLAAGWIGGLKGRERILLLIPVLTFVGAVSIASKQNGLRYILPVYPFLIIGAAAVVRLWDRKNIRLASLVLAGFAGVSAAMTAPHYLSYFNAAAGGAKNGHRWLVDSNLDWGQDFPQIKEVVEKNGNPSLIMATLGNANRDFYFGPHQDLLGLPGNPDDYFNHINPVEVKKEWLVVSASLYQGFGLTDPTLFDWLKKKEPVHLVTGSTFIFDVTRDLLSTYQMGLVYQRNNKPSYAERQFKRAALLAPEDPVPVLSLGDAYLAEGKRDLALTEFRKAKVLAEARGDERLSAIIGKKIAK